LQRARKAEFLLQDVLIPTEIEVFDVGGIVGMPEKSRKSIVGRVAIKCPVCTGSFGLDRSRF
jgi:hypothetical protein